MFKWLPKFLGWVDYQIFLGMGLCCKDPFHHCSSHVIVQGILFKDSTDTEKKRRVLPQVPGRKEVIIGNFIIYTAESASGNMRRFLWSVGYPSGQDGPIAPSPAGESSLLSNFYTFLHRSTLFGHDSGHWHRVFIKMQKIKIKNKLANIRHLDSRLVDNA